MFFLLLIGLTLAARSLSQSQKHLIPTYDEVAFLDVARDFHIRGGILETVKDYIHGECLEDKRQPHLAYDRGVRYHRRWRIFAA